MPCAQPITRNGARSAADHLVGDAGQFDEGVDTALDPRSRAIVDYAVKLDPRPQRDGGRGSGAITRSGLGARHC